MASQSQARLWLEPPRGANDEGERFVAMLKIPPVDSAQKAVHVQLVKDVKGKK